MYLTIIERRNPQSFYSDYEKMKYAQKLAKKKKYLTNLHNRQTVHAMICEMAGGCKRENEKLLFKVIGGRAEKIMIQSLHRFQSEKLSEFGYVKLSEIDIETLYNQNVENGVVLRFKAILAPTYKAKSNGAVKGIESLEDRINWVSRKFESAGAKVLSVYETEHELINLAHRHDSMNSFYNAYSYAGTLLIEDKDLLLEVVYNGIGRAKSYGAGLVILSK